MDWVMMHKELRSIGAELLEKSGGRKSRTMGVGIYVPHLGVSLIGFHRGKIWQSPSSGVSFLYSPANGPMPRANCLYRLLDLEQSIFLAEHGSLVLAEDSTGRYVQPSVLRRALLRQTSDETQVKPSPLAYQVYEFLREAGYIVRRLRRLRVSWPTPDTLGHCLEEALLLPTVSCLPPRISRQDWWWEVQCPNSASRHSSGVLATVVEADEAALPRLAAFYGLIDDGSRLDVGDTSKNGEKKGFPEEGWVHVDPTVGPSRTVVVAEDAKLVFIRIQELHL
eukprot:GHVS01076508.1.p1 GENE.GHVS01076508.1~~GHVS01076508.1.p1  ORF type:complete len:280 (-),score=24.49 GHVS01076508.1:63-902(-)